MVLYLQEHSLINVATNMPLIACARKVLITMSLPPKQMTPSTKSKYERIF